MKRTCLLWALALVGLASVAFATDPPPQLMTTVHVLPSVYGPVTPYRMANNGTGSHTARLLLHSDHTNETDPERGAFFEGGSITLLPYFTTPYATVHAGALCGLYDGYIGGFMDGKNANDFVPPCWWLQDGSSSDDQVTWSSFHRDGQFWDVNYDGVDHRYVGYIIDGNGVKQPAQWKSSDSTSSPSFYPIATATGGEAWCINKDKDAGGSLLFSGNVTTPAVWQYSAGSWTLIDVTTSTDWPSGRTGWIIGITDRNANDSAAPYAVGWMEAVENGAAAQPFIYSVGTGTIRFCGTYYDIPRQITNVSYDASDVIVSFVGQSNIAGKPYVWIGSPSKLSATTGVADDLWAFLDPDEARPNASLATLGTGINRAYRFGGSGFPSGTNPATNVWVTSTTTNWTRAANTYTRTQGSLHLGSSTSDIDLVDGKFCSIDATADPMQVVHRSVILQVDANVGAGKTAAFRPTTRIGSSVTASYQVDLKNWNTGAWDNFVNEGAMPAYWDTDLVYPAGTAYVSSSGQVSARITVHTTTSYPSATWHADFEQASWLYK